MDDDRMKQLLAMHAEDPTDPFCTYAVAMEHGKAGRDREAIAWFDKTLELDPHYCYAYFQKARVLDRMGDPSAREVVETGMSAAKDCGDDHALCELRDLLDEMTA